MSFWNSWYAALAKYGKWINIDPLKVKPVISITYGCGSVDRPDFSSIKVAFGRDRTQSLYYNGIFFFRFMLPFFVSLSIRWSGKLREKPKWMQGRKVIGGKYWAQFMQTHIGWKLNGEFAPTLRFQNDPSAFKSNVGPAQDNYGQATGWECGTK